MAELRMMFLLRLYMKLPPRLSFPSIPKTYEAQGVFHPPPACLLDVTMSLTQNRTRVVMACL